MAHIHDALAQRIRTLESELERVLEQREQDFRYSWIKGKARFDAETLAAHRRLKTGLVGYLLSSRILAVVTAPLIYVGLIPFALLDIFLALFQSICFPIYGIPQVRRGDFITLDGGRLKYLNSLERINCTYCSYANGLFAYAAEVAGRTEQHWCPIKHARRLRSPHSRYSHFLEYGDAERYRQEVGKTRNDFVDLVEIK
jgi:hypothetical protein